MSENYDRPVPRAFRRGCGAGVSAAIGLLVMLCLGVGGLVVPLFGEENEEAGGGWWFPSDIKDGMLHDYHLAVTLEMEDGGTSTRLTQEADFTVSISRDETKPGCIMRLVGVKDPGQSGLAALLSGFVRKDDKGVRITQDRLFFREGLLLRGRWKRGARFSIATLIMTFFNLSVGVNHVDVKSVNAREAHLVSEFWLGKSGPDVTGSGNVWFTKDDDGLTSVRAESRWGNKRFKRTLELIIKRKRIYAKPATTQPQGNDRPLRGGK